MKSSRKSVNDNILFLMPFSNTTSEVWFAVLYLTPLNNVLLNSCFETCQVTSYNIYIFNNLVIIM